MKGPAWLYRFVPHLGRRATERDLQEELRLHLERERQRDAGVPEAEAMPAARRRLGNGTLIRDRTRGVWGSRWLDDLGRDVRHAARGLQRSPGFAGTVVLVLALGIGANTALFSVVYDLLLRPLPYPDSDAIVLVGKVWPDSTAPPTLTNPELRGLWADAESFEQLGASSRFAVTWSRPDGNLSGAAVTPSYFSVLGAVPHLGRLFTSADAEEGAPPVVLLSHDVWTSRFGSDPHVAILLVAGAAVWTAGAARRATPRVLGAIGAGLAVGFAAAPLAGVLVGGGVALAQGAAGHAGHLFADEQGAAAILPAFQMGLFAALWVAAASGTAWRRAALGFGVLVASQAVLAVLVGELAHHYGFDPHVGLIRAWAIALPVRPRVAACAHGLACRRGAGASGAPAGLAAPWHPACRVRTVTEITLPRAAHGNCRQAGRS